jgi:uncharacterized membrane protein YfcA
MVSVDWFLGFGCFGAALGISFFTSMTGVSGAFALVPFQISVLGIAGPVVSSTNHLYNLIATPGGITRYLREGRLAWRLLAILGSGSVPGAVVGAWVRVRYLPEAGQFRLFAGVVLLVMGVRLLTGAKRPGRAGGRVESGGAQWLAPLDAPHSAVQVPLLVPAAFLIGIAGGAYGIGGAVMIAPILVSVMGWSFEQIAGALLGATFLTSLASVVTYQFLARSYPLAGASPDWSLGLMFGFGGLVGTYLGSRFRKRFSPRVLRFVLAGSVLLVGLRYLWAA